MKQTTQPFSEYAPSERLPLAGYMVTLLCFVAGFALVARRIGRRAGYRPKVSDVLLLGASTHKLTRIVAKDFVTAPLRAPFTRRGEPEGAGEVHDIPRGKALRQTLGNLVSCPYCLGPWTGTALAAALVLRPRETRFTLAVLTAVAISDFLHQRYATLNEARKLAQWERKQAEIQHESAARGIE